MDQKLISLKLESSIEVPSIQYPIVTGYGKYGQSTSNRIVDAINSYNNLHPDNKLTVTLRYDKKHSPRFIIGNSKDLNKENLVSLLKNEGYLCHYPEVNSERNENGDLIISFSYVNHENYGEPEGGFFENEFFGKGYLSEHNRRNFIGSHIPLISPNDKGALAEQLRPWDPKIPYNAEQIIYAPPTVIHPGVTGASNFNADLGLQYTIKCFLLDIVAPKNSSGIRNPSYVILTSGHAIAGLVPLSAMEQQLPDGTRQFLFDTSVYMPLGGWSPDYGRTGVASQGALLWSDQIRINKEKSTREGASLGNGIAIALNGHRGDGGYGEQKGTANIVPNAMFGTPKEFKVSLQKRGLSRVVIITEHMINDPTIPNILTLEHLKNSGSGEFDVANKDLYGYMSELRSIGIEIIVVSGEQRRR